MLEFKYSVIMIKIIINMLDESFERTHTVFKICKNM